MQITIIGAGNMGRGIATRALVGAHRVRMLDHHADKAGQVVADLRAAFPAADVQVADRSALDSADIVVLAVKYPAVPGIIDAFAAALTGKVVVDISNPADVATFDPTTPPGSSAAEEIAAALPGARIVKAFNTTFAATLTSGSAGDAPLDVYLASDDAEAKAVVADFASSAALNPVDVGPLRRARALESFQIMHMSLQQTMPNPWHSAIKIVV